MNAIVLSGDEPGAQLMLYVKGGAAERRVLVVTLTQGPTGELSRTAILDVSAAKMLLDGLEQLVKLLS